MIMPDIAPDDLRHRLWAEGDQFATQMLNHASATAVRTRQTIWSKYIEEWLATREAVTSHSLRIIDVGCGDGINSVWLAEYFARQTTSFSLTGIDNNPTRIRRVRSHGILTSLISAALPNLPFADGVFDLILCNHVLEHLVDPIPAMKEIRRITSTRGLIIIGVPNEGCFLGWTRNHIFQRSILRTTDHKYFFTAHALREMLSQSEMSVSAILRNTVFFFPHFGILSRIRNTTAGNILHRLS